MPLLSAGPVSVALDLVALLVGQTGLVPVALDLVALLVGQTGLVPVALDLVAQLVVGAVMGAMSLDLVARLVVGAVMGSALLVRHFAPPWLLIPSGGSTFLDVRRCRDLPRSPQIGAKRGPGVSRALESWCRLPQPALET